MFIIVLAILFLLVTRSSILGTIFGIFSGVGNDLVKLVTGAWNAIKSVFSFFARLADLVGGAWDWMVNGISWIGHQAAVVALDGYHFIGWILFHGIPDAVNWVWKQAWGLAARALKHAINWARDAVNVATRFLHGIIHTLGVWAKDAVRFVLGLANKALHWIEVAGKWVWGVVSHPDRLARWILEPFARLMVREWAFFARLFAHLFPGLMGRVATSMVDAIETWLLRLL